MKAETKDYLKEASLRVGEGIVTGVIVTAVITGIGALISLASSSSNDSTTISE